MLDKKSTVLVVTVFMCIAAGARAEDLVRDSDLIESIPIQGVALEMSAEVAFDRLRSAGFRAGNLETYGDWQSNGIEFVRGVYGSPEGFSSVTMERRGDRLVHIAETFNRPGGPIDATAEIGAVRDRLGIPADAKKCQISSAHSGTCEVRDAADAENVNAVFTLQVISTMRMVHATRTKELKGDGR